MACFVGCRRTTTRRSPQGCFAVPFRASVCNFFLSPPLHLGSLKSWPRVWRTTGNGSARNTPRTHGAKRRWRYCGAWRALVMWWHLTRQLWHVPHLPLERRRPTCREPLCLGVRAVGYGRPLRLRDVDLIDNMHRKSDHIFYHNFYPKAIVNVNHTILITKRQVSPVNCKACVMKCPVPLVCRKVCDSTMLEIISYACKLQQLEPSHGG